MGVAFASVLLILGSLVYLPGISGPYVFDDAVNLLSNSYVQISELNATSLYHAAFSLQSGPLHRPVAMLTFALNYYFAGTFDDPLPFKLTNIAIHLGNGLLMFLIVRLILERLGRTGRGAVPFGNLTDGSMVLLATMAALFWTVHPIQITSVLYVVQRMASLSALFTLLGILCYLKGRLRIVAGKAGGARLILLGLIGFGGLGILSKENAVLLPLFMLTLEYTLFPNELPWTRWRELSLRSRRILVFAAFLVVVLALSGVVLYALPGYAIRNFTLMERLLTEPRVLFFYLSLLVAPRIDQFALYHDEFPVSTALLSPWTTSPSAAGIIGLLALALSLRRKHPLLSLGILWFFAGHALESTLIGLEIIHEHRNYMASLGVWLVFLHVIIHAHNKYGKAWIWVIPPIMAITFAGVTLMRSLQWADFYTLASYEAAHHARSADAQNFLGVALARQDRYTEAFNAFKHASELNRNEALYRVNMHVAASIAGITLGRDEEAETLRRMKDNIDSASVFLALENINDCVHTKCRNLQTTVLYWTEQLIETLPPHINRALFYYLRGNALAGLGRTEEAITAFMRSYQEDKKYLHPLIEATKIYIQKHNIDKAEEVLEMLRAANRGNLHPRDAEIAKLAENIGKLKKEQKISP